MADHSDHSHARAGEPPPVRDEAAETPMWLPIFGLCLLVLAALGIVWQAARGEEEEAPAQEAAQEEAAQEEAPAEEPAPSAEEGPE